MKYVLLFYSLIIVIAYSLGVFLIDLKILQLEEYRESKLLKYNLRHNKINLILSLLSPLALMVLLVQNSFIENLSIIIVMTIWFLFYIAYIIKRIYCNIYPKFTKRILRIFIMYILVSILYYLLSTKYNIIPYMCMIIPINMQILTIVVNLFVKIFECILSNFYAKNASKKINKCNLIKIAITGSYAKTSVKNILLTILQEKFCVISSPKSYNTINGFSLTAKNNNLSKYDVFIMEMGAKKKGEIKKLCKLFKPQYGILTAIEKQHLESFKNIENIIAAKKELQDNLYGDSFMVFNCNNEYVNKLYSDYVKKKISVGIDEKSGYDVSGEIVDISENGCKFNIFYMGEYFCIAESSLVGVHHISNILLSVAIAIKLGLTKEQIVAGIRKLKPVESRMQPISIGNESVVINNGYNSNPSSAKASLNLLKLYDKTKVVIACGFVEMGKEQYSLNKQLGKQISQIADVCYVVNKVNRKAIICGLKEGQFKKELIIVDKFKDINFSVFKNSVILIENDLPDNYI